MVENLNLTPLDAFDNKVDVFSNNIYSHASNNEWICDPFIGFRLKKITRKINNQIILKTNSMGIRASEIFLKEKYDTIFIGGSFVYGAFAPSENETIPSYYEKIIKSKVLNAGIGGHVLKQHFSLFFNYLKSIKAKKLIFIFGFNDMGNCFNGKEYKNIKLDIFEKKINKVLENPIKQSFIVIFSQILNILKLRKLVKNIFFKKKISNVISSESYIDKYIDELSNDLEEFNKMQLNKKIFFFIQPNLITSKKKLSNYEKIVINNRDENKKNFCKIFHQKLENKIFRINNVYNLNNIFDHRNDTIFIDDAHIGDKGNLIVANKIFDIVSKC